MISVEKPGSPAEILEHHGTKGMHWGVRTGGVSGGARSAAAKVGSSKAGRAAKATGRGLDNTIFEFGAHSARTEQAVLGKAAEKLHADLPGIKASHGAYGKLRNRVKHPFSPEAKAYRSDVKKAYLKHLESSANELTNIRGTRRYTLKENGEPNTSQYNWKLKTEAVSHADAVGEFTVRPIFDSEGYIIDIELVNGDVAQSATNESYHLEHHGTKGMKWGVRNASTQAFREKHPTMRSRSDAIRRARSAQMDRAVKFKTERNPTKRANLKKTFLKHPDRVTAARLTSGEKAVLGLMAVSGVGSGAAIGAAAGNVAGRHMIERRQARGAYN